MRGQIHIAIAEDHDIVRQGFISLLKDNKTIKVVIEVNNGKDLLVKLKGQRTDIVLLDIEMPVMNGEQTIELLKKRFPKIKVIVISAYFREAFVIEYLKKGASAFLPKNIQIAELVEAINTVHTKGAYYGSEVSAILAKEVVGDTSQIITDENGQVYTPTELNIINLISKSKTSKEIAEILNLKVRTVEWHRGQLMKKMNAKNVSALLLYAINNKLIET